MEIKSVHNCIRNCWEIDKCSICENFKSVRQAQQELDKAREMFNLIIWKVYLFFFIIN